MFRLHGSVVGKLIVISNSRRLEMSSQLSCQVDLVNPYSAKEYAVQRIRP